MGRLFLFVYQYRAFFTFLSLEILCAFLIIQNNRYQSSHYFNTSNAAVANIIATSNGIKEYFGLRELNRELAEENARLHQSLDRQKNMLGEFNLTVVDSIKIKAFTYTSAKVVNNSINLSKNYLTINKGLADGIAPGMAVVSAQGVVGKVKSVSQHYSVVISLLNIDEQVSSTLLSSRYFCTSQWDGADPELIDLKYVPRHVALKVGDTIVTSGFNAIFPEGVMIGVVKQFDLKEEALFYTIRVKLAQDFGRLAYVDVIKSNLKKERDSLERITIKEIK